MNKKIEIKSLAKEYLPHIKYIWKECFGDSDEFLEVYFSDILKCDSGFGLYENGELVSDLFMRPLRSKLDNYMLHAYFLAGCATLPEARKKDYMKSLIKHTLEYFYKRGDAVTYLHPFKHSFYRKFGYETIAYVNNYLFKNHNKKNLENILITNKYYEIPVHQLWKTYSNKMKNYNNCFMRDENHFAGWIKLLCADGGKAAFICADNAIECYALLYETEDDLCEIFELISSDNMQIKKLISELPFENIKYFLPSDENYKTQDNEEFTMMRVVNPIAALDNYRFIYDTEFVVKIYDEFLEKEYKLSVKSENHNNKIINTDAKADFEVDINRFAQLITGSYAPDISKYEKVIFYRQSSCFFETY